MDEKEKKSEK